MFLRGELEPSVGELAKSVDADLISLSQYAVEHRSGGVYYPNAVLPIRGLLETPRYAAFRPVDQLSGYVGGLARFIIFAAYGYIYPSAYREVKADRTFLYFDVLAEENSTFTEEFYVTQSGIFATPAVTVESAYAPHYRANGNAERSLTVE